MLKEVWGDEGGEMILDSRERRTEKGGRWSPSHTTLNNQIDGSTN